MYRIFCSLFFLPLAASAGTTIYTDSQHLPVNPPDGVRVVLLDAPEQLQSRFGACCLLMRVRLNRWSGYV